MKEGKFIDGISPEKEAEEAPYMEDWEGKQEPFLPLPWWGKVSKAYLDFERNSDYNFIFLFQRATFKASQEVVCFPNHNRKRNILGQPAFPLA